jgi:hypothetical protein
MPSGDANYRVLMPRTTAGKGDAGTVIEFNSSSVIPKGGMAWSLLRQDTISV